ncbi:hypothetical protein PILCRDRAFT_815871 [Piloderma croceum F 1598]|uniref:Uncharacterized protein n=1 Tax=Piloderma croceum (strain F 1598) TaxID=765440 RepID=A0A0C3FRT5_PILCF|nr:hypothetical protein PILCRDRAFT_815871 [Piloderma croceum F 1598]
MPAEEISSLTDLLQTRRTLSSSETALIESTYRETHSSISQLDDGGSQLLHQQQARHTYRQTLGHGALLSPVQRLPPELLGAIFELCLPINCYKKGVHRAVMLPSHICRHWRSVALSIPRLWSKIVLYVNDWAVESKTALVTAWMSRSGGSSLSISLNGSNVRPILDVILLHCDRWQHIDLFIPPKMLQCFEQANGHFDRLETLQICSSSFHIETFHPPRRIFESAPKLRTLSFKSGFTWKSFDIPWAQITDFDGGICEIRVGECLEMLQCLGNVQKLRIRLRPPGVDRPILRPFILDFHSLISLHLWKGGNIGALFDHLTLPNLRDLALDDSIADEWPQAQFISFLSRSSPPLSEFSIGSSDDCMADNNLIEILQHTPSLRFLSLKYFDCEACMDGSLLDRLSPRMLENGEIDCLIPKLETIFVKLPRNGKSPPFEAFTDMIISRCRLTHTVMPDDSDSKAIGPIQMVKVEAFEEHCVDELLDGLAPLQGLSDVCVDSSDALYTLYACPTPSGESGPYFKGPWRVAFYPL